MASPFGLHEDLQSTRTIGLDPRGKSHLLHGLDVFRTQEYTLNYNKDPLCDLGTNPEFRPFGSLGEAKSR